jgi:hypothetical protein
MNLSATRREGLIRQHVAHMKQSSGNYDGAVGIVDEATESARRFQRDGFDLGELVEAAQQIKQTIAGLGVTLESALLAPRFSLVMIKSTVLPWARP